MSAYAYLIPLFLVGFGLAAAFWITYVPPLNRPGVLKRLSDWWRGYSDADVRSLREKFGRKIPPGSVTELTHPEMKALADGRAGPAGIEKFRYFAGVGKP